MTDYTKITDFASKDTLASGNPSKIIKGSEINAEFESIQTHIATKADEASPTFTGTLTADIITASGTLTANLIDGGTY